MTTTTISRIAVAAVLLASAPYALAQTSRDPGRSRASTRSTSTTADGGLRLAGLLGFEFANGDTGLALRGDGEMRIADLAPNLHLSGVLSLGYSRFSDDNFRVDVTTNLVKLVPALRLTIPVAPQFGVYGDAGLGLYYASTTVRDNLSGLDASDSDVDFTMRFAAGAFFDLNERLRLGAELGVNPYFGDLVDDTTWTLLASLSYRL
jgi:opacity protein-like surface antigen